MARKRFSLSLSLVFILPLRGRFNKAALQRDGQAERLTSWTLASLDRPPSLPFALSFSHYASNYGGNVDLETDFVSSNPFCFCVTLLLLLILPPALIGCKEVREFEGKKLQDNGSLTMRMN